MQQAISAVIFDWAGTTVDFGCFAPLKVFVEIFARRGVRVSFNEARGPMGMLKKDHIRAMLGMDRVSALWEGIVGHAPCQADVDALYRDFEPALMSVLTDYCDPLDGLTECCAWLGQRGIKIGSTTGYTAEMMRIVCEGAAKAGYAPDEVITAEDVGQGRPAPFMIYENMRRLGISCAGAVVKVGDTVSDIAEGKNAGVVSVGVTVGSSVMGLSRQAYEALSTEAKLGARDKARMVYKNAGADYVIDSLNELPSLIERLEARTQSGNPYLLLTPGPLSTTSTVKEAMLRDWCTWDDDYNNLIQTLRCDLVSLATSQADRYTAVLMQGSGTFSVESVIGSVISKHGKLLVATNGAYGERIVRIAQVLGINVTKLDFGETGKLDIARVGKTLLADPELTHVAVVHCETTTGMLNDIAAVGVLAKAHGKVFIVDAMSSFGGIPMDVAKPGIDFMISSANKCIQGVPGFGFVIASRSELEKCSGTARSLSLDLYGQWRDMEDGHGKWRYTSPTHVVRAFVQAMLELQEEGGIEARYARYHQNQLILTRGMRALGFETLLPDELHSPIITSFMYPTSTFDFTRFYKALKQKGFVVYPGKISKADTFRIGNIGDVQTRDIDQLLCAVSDVYNDCI